MREIKFRGKSCGVWYYGDLHLLCNKPHIHIQQSSYPFGGERRFIEVSTIGQFTGLKDKNGVEIYEGDIVVRHDVTFDTKKTCLVVYDDNTASYRLHYKGEYYESLNWFETKETFDDGYCTLESEYEYEVIGNVYDNKELLDNQKE